MLSTLLIITLVFALAGYVLGRARSLSVANGNASQLHSRPVYHGAYVFLHVLIPGALAAFLWNWFSQYQVGSAISDKYSTALEGLTLPQAEAFLRDVETLAKGGKVAFSNEQKVQAAELFQGLSGTYYTIGIPVISALCVAIGFYAYRQLSLKKRTRQAVEKAIRWILLACSVVAILTTVGIVLSLIFESIRFFGKVAFLDFLFGIHWSPQSAFEGAGSEGSADNSRVFGAIPLFAGSFLITFIAMCVAAPIGLMSAIYLPDYASNAVRKVAKPVLEILAGVPTVVYGFFAALTVAPAFRGMGESIGLDVSSESALAAGLVMGIMIIPFVSSLSDDVINAVPQSLRDGSAGLGATKSETIRKVVLPAALPGIVSAMLLAISRAVGETMIVVMAAGLAANLTINPLEAVTTVTVQIVTLLVGDQEFDSAKTLAAFALGLILFVVTLILNVIALRVVQKYREQYD